MKSIMYHYVREYDDKHPNFRFLDIQNFRKQLDFFEKNFGFVDAQEWESFITNGQMPDQEGKVVLTFDDAMSCHYEFVFPELIKRGLWGIFYVPTAPYMDNKLLDVHRVHLLCGAVDGEELFHEAMKLIDEDMIPDSKRKEFREQTYTNQTNYEGVSEFKRLLNYFIDYDRRESFIDVLSDVFGYQYSANSFYVQKTQLSEMFDHGMIFGSHTVSHPVMSKLTRADQTHEITSSFAFLDELNLTKHKTYCHPYGGFHSFDQNTVEILDEQNVAYSFNVDYRDITQQDIIANKQSLPRYDCNLFEFGKAS
ncbi:MAG: polysaccharide deacetylase family protein [Lentilitoribacter sp.]